MIENVKKLIAEMEQEVKYFVKLQDEAVNSTEAMNWRIEQIKRNYALEKLKLLLEV